MLEADFEVMASPVLLWIRVLIAPVLGLVFGGLGLSMFLGGAFGLLDQADSPGIGSAFGALTIGVGALAASSVVFKAGWATFRAYRKRDLV
jgi:hypothetical protein